MIWFKTHELNPPVTYVAIYDPELDPTQSDWPPPNPANGLVQGAWEYILKQAGQNEMTFPATLGSPLRDVSVPRYISVISNYGSTASWPLNVSTPFEGRWVKYFVHHGITISGPSSVCADEPFQVTATGCGSGIVTWHDNSQGNVWSSPGITSPVTVQASVSYPTEYFGNPYTASASHAINVTPQNIDIPTLNEEIDLCDLQSNYTEEQLLTYLDTSSMNSYDPDRVAYDYLTEEQLYWQIINDTVNPANDSALAYFVSNTELMTGIDDIDSAEAVMTLGIASGDLQSIATAMHLFRTMSLTEAPETKLQEFYNLYAVYSDLEFLST